MGKTDGAVSADKRKAVDGIENGIERRNAGEKNGSWHKSIHHYRLLQQCGNN